MAKIVSFERGVLLRAFTRGSRGYGAWIVGWMTMNLVPTHLRGHERLLGGGWHFVPYCGRLHLDPAKAWL
jgi:hypothetical protein